mgnify:CR=1 FL=1
MYLGRVMGVNLRVHYLFLLPLLVWAATGHLLPGTMAFLSVVVHEFGHLTVAKQLGFTPKEVQLLPFGGVASLQENLGLDPAAEMRIALAGPWTSLLLIGAGVLLRSLFPTQALFDLFLQMNITLVLFNLLPALPLDGGRIYRAYLVAEQGFKAGTIRAVRASRVCSLVFFLVGVTLMLASPLALNLVIIAGFLYFSSRRILAESSLQLLAYLSSKQRELAKSGTMATAILAVAFDCEAGDLLEYFVPKKYHLIYVLGAAGQVVGMVSEEQVLQAIFEQGLGVRLERLLK